MATTTRTPPARGLGKGLSALISENYTKPASAAAKPKASPSEPPAEGLHEMQINLLRAGKYQPRSQFDEGALTELAESIEKNGLMQPILVRAVGEYYEIIAGERRWRAAKIAGLAKVPVLIREVNDTKALELALVENIQRQDLNPLEEAKGYQRLVAEFDYTQEEISSVVGKSRSHVANLMRLLGLPDEVKNMLEEGQLSMSHARALLTAPDPLALARDIVRRGLNVRQVEAAARETAAKPRAPRAAKQAPANAGYAAPKDPDLVALEDSLSENLGLRVSINDRGQKGEIVISYDTLSQLDEVLRRLNDGKNSTRF